MPPPDAYHGHSSAPARAPGRRPSLAFPRQQGRARNPLFFGGVLHRFFEDLVLQRLLAEHTLQLDNLGARGCQLGGRHHGLAGGHGHQRALAFELAPLEQQAGGNTFLPGHERHAHAGLIGSPHERRFLGQGPAPTALVPRDHFDRLCIPSRIHSPTPILKDKRWTVYGHSGGQLRLRCYAWKQWGPRGYRELRRRGVSVREAWNVSKSAHGPWRLSQTPALSVAMPTSFFSAMGLPQLATARA